MRREAHTGHHDERAEKTQSPDPVDVRG